MKNFRWLMISKMKVAIGWTILALLLPVIAFWGLLFLGADWLWPSVPGTYPDPFERTL